MFPFFMYQQFCIHYTDMKKDMKIVSYVPYLIIGTRFTLIYVYIHIYTQHSQIRHRWTISTLLNTKCKGFKIKDCWYTITSKWELWSHEIYQIDLSNHWNIPHVYINIFYNVLYSKINNWTAKKEHPKLNFEGNVFWHCRDMSYTSVVLPTCESSSPPY